MSHELHTKHQGTNNLGTEPIHTIPPMTTHEKEGSETVLRETMPGTDVKRHWGHQGGRTPRTIWLK